MHDTNDIVCIVLILQIIVNFNNYILFKKLKKTLDNIPVCLDK